MEEFLNKKSHFPSGKQDFLMISHSNSELIFKPHAQVFYDAKQISHGIEVLRLIIWDKDSKHFFAPPDQYNSIQTI